MQVRRLDVDALEAMRDEWSELLARSDADPLFSSHEWMTTWWRHQAGDFGLEPFFLAAYQAERLVGIAPFHRRLVRHAPGVRGVRLELVGNIWRTSSVTMSERTGFIVDRTTPHVYRELALHAMKGGDWTDLVVAHTDVDGPTCRAVREVASESGLYSRVTDVSTAYLLDMTDGFEAFLGRLSGKTRRRLYNERRKIAAFGTVAWELATTDTLGEFLESLDRLHVARWGWPASAGRRGRMYRAIAESQLARGELALSRLRVGSRVVAASLDFRAGGIQYGIQKAVDTEFSPKVSPGYLQEGYNLESAWQQGIRRFDFLAGDGKSTDYKSKFGASSSQLGCVQVIRSPLLSAIHRAGDALGRERLRWVRRLGR